MNRLLLSLWLLGAVVFVGSALVSLHAIFGWPYNTPRIETPAVQKAGGDAVRGPEPATQSVAVPMPPLPPVSQDRPALEPLQRQQQAVRPVESMRSLEQHAAESDMAPEPEQDDEAWVRVASKGANLRAGPSSSARRLSSFPAGTELRVLAREKEWVQVADADGGGAGWIYERLLEFALAPRSTAEAAGEQDQQGERVRVMERAAIVRSGASEDAPMLFGFPYGRELRVVSRQPGWVEIVDLGSGQTGWIAETSLQADVEQTAVASPQRRSRGAYAEAEAPSGAQAGRLPWDEELGQRSWNERPKKRWRKARRNSVFTQALRRAFGGF